MASYSSHFSVRRLWTILAASMLVMFGTLLYFGKEIYQAAPPIPAVVRTESREVVFTGDQILRGQNVWRCRQHAEQTGDGPQSDKPENHVPSAAAVSGTRRCDSSRSARLHHEEADDPTQPRPRITTHASPAAGLVMWS